MITYVKGTVAGVTVSSAIVEVGGVGLELIATPNTLAGLRLGGTVTLATSLVVREDSLTLFGFADDDEKQVFELVQTASGVGPKLAQALLAVLSPDGIRAAIAGDDVKSLTKVPGVGQKGAQRLILELKDRIGRPLTHTGALPVTTGPAWRDQVTQAVVGLGYTAKDAERAVDAIADQAGDTPNIAHLLRAALQSLGKA